jgi:hypothetical protein
MGIENIAHQTKEPEGIWLYCIMRLFIGTDRLLLFLLTAYYIFPPLNPVQALVHPGTATVDVLQA